MLIQSSSSRTQARRRENIREAIAEGDWLKIKYAGEDRVVIPQKLDTSSQGKELLRGVLAESSEPRSFRTDRIENLRRLPDSEQDAAPQIARLARRDENVAKLQEAVEDQCPVTMEYHIPGKQPVTMTVNPEGFDIQPDKSLALEATNSKGQDRKYRLDRICSVDLEN